MNELDPAEQKRLLKEAIKEGLREWLNEQWAMFGKWTAHGLLALLFAALTYFWFATHGYKVTP